MAAGQTEQGVPKLVRRPAGRDLWRGAHAGPCGRRRTSSGRETHGSACGGQPRAGKCVSWLCLAEKKLCIRAFSAPSCQGKSRPESTDRRRSALWISRAECAYNAPPTGTVTAPEFFLQPRTFLPHVDRLVLAELPGSVPARAHAAAVQYLDPAAAPRAGGGGVGADRAQPLRAAVGQGALRRAHRGARDGRARTSA